MKYEAVLLDMDGTVLDTVQDIQDSLNASLREFGLPEVDTAKTKANLGNASRYLISHCVPEGTPPELTEKVLEFYLPYYDAHSHIKTSPYEGISELMEKLKNSGLRLAIISNKPMSTVAELAEEFFPGKLECAVGQSEQLRRKPEPDMVFKVLEDMGLRADRCVYVGDSEVDIKTAGNAGMDCVSVSWGFRTREQLVEAGASRIADSVNELYNIITE